MTERDLADAIYREIVSPQLVNDALYLFLRCEDGAEGGQAERMRRVLGHIAIVAIEAVLARRVSEAARTGPWDAPCDERERCARHIEALAVALRDHGPTTPEGLLTGIAGAQVGALLDAAASLRLTRDPSPWEGGHHCQEEDGYPGSLLPPKRGTP